MTIEIDSSLLEERKLIWVGAVTDVMGGLEIEGRNTASPYSVLTFETTYPEILEEIQGAVGGLGKFSGPIRARKGHWRDRYRLRFSGVHFHVFTNIVLNYMRLDSKKEVFARHWAELRRVRQEKGLHSPFVIPAAAN